MDMGSGESVVEAAGVRRSYGGGSGGNFEAVRGVSFEVARGELFALLGTNGARKTSTVELLEGLARPSGGMVRVLGRDPHAERARAPSATTCPPPPSSPPGTATRPYAPASAAGSRSRAVRSPETLRKSSCGSRGAMAMVICVTATSDSTDRSRRSSLPPPPPRLKPRQLARNVWRSRAQLGQLPYWLVFRGGPIFLGVAAAFVVSGVMIGWGDSYDVLLGIESPRSSGNNAATWILSLVGWLGVPSLIGAVAGHIVSAGITARRKATYEEIVDLIRRELPGPGPGSGSDGGRGDG